VVLTHGEPAAVHATDRVLSDQDLCPRATRLGVVNDDAVALAHPQQPGVDGPPPGPALNEGNRCHGRRDAA